MPSHRRGGATPLLSRLLPPLLLSPRGSICCAPGCGVPISMGPREGTGGSSAGFGRAFDRHPGRLGLDPLVEDHHVDYMGLANNDRLKSESAEAMTQAEAEFNGDRRGCSISVRTRHSWTSERRVAKAEFLEKGANPRASPPCRRNAWGPARSTKTSTVLENRIKEQQLGLPTGPTMRANQLICPPPPTCSCTPCVRPGVRIG